ncbi:MAG: hypothetical protein ACK5Y2_01785 [Bdellovibrionales bacterium]
MKQWLLYCLICSLIFAMAVQASAANSTEVTAELVFYDGQRVGVRDCALFMPSLGSQTDAVKKGLKALGFSPQVTPGITIEALTFKDSNGHRVDEYETQFDSKIGYYGQYTVLMSVKGYRIERRKKSIFILKLHRLGAKEAEVASSVHTGVLDDRSFSVKDLPRCQPKARR